MNPTIHRLTSALLPVFMVSSACHPEEEVTRNEEEVTRNEEEVLYSPISGFEIGAEVGEDCLAQNPASPIGCANCVLRSCALDFPDLAGGFIECLAIGQGMCNSGYGEDLLPPLPRPIHVPIDQLCP